MRWLAVAALFALGGCVAAVDFDAFHRDGVTLDGGVDGSIDTTSDAGPLPETTDAGVEAGSDASVLFADNFDRANGAVANGWTQALDDSYEVGSNALKLTTNNAWSLLATDTTTDSSADQLRNAGMFGISADGNPNLTYDNFVATAARAP